MSDIFQKISISFDSGKKTILVFLGTVRFCLLALAFILIVKNWEIPLFSVWKLTKFPKKLTLFLRNGLIFQCSDRIDVISILEVFFQNQYRFDPHNVKTVIDIGANYGSFSVFAAYFSPQIKVYSYEPSKETFQMLTFAVKKNILQNQITPINKAVSSKNGKIQLYNLGRTGSKTTLHPNAYISREIVPTVNLNHVFMENRLSHCDFLKMDCEGAEYDILLHTSSSTFRKIEKISLEYHLFPPNSSVNVLVKKLKKEGFVVEVKRDMFVEAVGYLFAQKSSKG